VFRHHQHSTEAKGHRAVRHPRHPAPAGVREKIEPSPRQEQGTDDDRRREHHRGRSRHALVPQEYQRENGGRHVGRECGGMNLG